MRTRDDRPFAAAWPPSLAVAAAALLAVAVTGCGAPEEGGEAGARETAAASGADSGTAGGATPAADDSAAVWQRRLMAALGGQEAWERTRYLHFDWVVDRGGTPIPRNHTWDRWSGRYRLAFRPPDGPRFLALFNVNEVRRDSALGKVPAGEAWRGEERLSGAARDSALHRAYAVFINDTYWLLMPFKWTDPGVHMEWAGRTELSDGRRYPTIHLTFESDLGVTNDQYWGFVDPETHRLHAWRYHLEGRDEKGAVIRWEGWRQVGPIMLATNRIWPDGSRNIWFEDLAAADSVPPGAFTREGR